MTKKMEVYKCKVCGNIVTVLHAGMGQLVCCAHPMTLMEAKTEDSATEKHVPYIEKTDKGVLVKVGQNQDHPMESEHYIEWIQVIADDLILRKFLKSGDKPQAEFEITADNITAMEYCNVHGLWTT